MRHPALDHFPHLWGAARCDGSEQRIGARALDKDLEAHVLHRHEVKRTQALGDVAVDTGQGERTLDFRVVISAGGKAPCKA